ncbi:MAG: hypothetical protein WDZ35_04965 [Crocinitomicaceae bacterium]
MRSIIDTYLGWEYVSWFAFILLIFWVIVGTKFETSTNKSNPSKGQKIRKWGFRFGVILLALNALFVTVINPYFFGYGKPAHFTLIHASDTHVLLFDEVSAHMDVVGEEFDRREDEIPSLRIHVADIAEQKKLYSYLIGDYLRPEEYGEHVLLIENNTYNKWLSENTIQSLSYFDVLEKKQVILAKKDESIQVEGTDIPVYYFTYEDPYWLVVTLEGDKYYLDQKTLEFKADRPKEEIQETKVHHSFKSKGDKVSTTELYINGENTQLEFVEAKTINQCVWEKTTYLLIVSYTNLSKKVPLLSCVDGKGNLLWQKNPDDFRELANENDLTEVDLTFFRDDLCYVTINNYLFEIDLLSGELNWCVGI